MKKIICMLMVICLTVSMVACSAQKESNEKIPETTNTTESKVETKPKEPVDVVGNPETTPSETESTDPATDTNATEGAGETDEEDTKPIEDGNLKDKQNSKNDETKPTNNKEQQEESKPTDPPATELPATQPPTEPEKEETKPTEPAPTVHQHSCTTTIVDPTCGDGGYTIEHCACGYEDIFNTIPALGHKFGEWTTVTEPTASTNGQKMRSCSVCDYQEFETIEKLATCTEHIWVVTEKESVDKYPLRHYGYVTTACSVCGEKKSTEAKYFRPDDINCSAEASTIVALVNSMRASEGLSQLTTNGDWNSWAATRAQEISIVYSHNRPNGASWGRNDGINMAFGENIAKNCNSGSDFYYGFLNSPQHSGLMRMPDATGIAVSIYVNEYGDSYCVMVIYGPMGF